MNPRTSARGGHTRRARSASVDHAIAAAWGFAEATAFFVVPDVWTSWVGLRRPRRAVLTTGSALAGALAGGAVMHRWGAAVDVEHSRKLLARVPGVSEPMVRMVEDGLRARGHAAMMDGPRQGIPYKLYARSSGALGMSRSGFLLWSVPARQLRFLLVTLGVSGIAARARGIPGIDERLISLGCAGCWIVFYTWFLRTQTDRFADGAPAEPHTAEPLTAKSFIAEPLIAEQRGG